MLKICSVCDTPKNELEYNFRNKIKNIRHSLCKECDSESKKNHYETHKQQYLDKAKKFNGEQRKLNRYKILEYLLTHPCVKCGEDDPIVLQFHHIISSTKKYNVGSMSCMALSWNTIQKEIDKCEVLCANCHVKVTNTQRNYFKNQILW